MTLIFSASTDLGSSQHSSRILGPLLRWLFPHLPAETTDGLITFIRKGGHVSEYGVLTLLVWRARRLARPQPAPSGWDARSAVAAGWLAVLYAATDEFHQTFVPSREGCVRDVAIDSCGVALALLALWLCCRWFAGRKKGSPAEAGAPMLSP